MLICIIYTPYRIQLSLVQNSLIIDNFLSFSHVQWPNCFVNWWWCLKITDLDWAQGSNKEVSESLDYWLQQTTVGSVNQQPDSASPSSFIYSWYNGGGAEQYLAGHHKPTSMVPSRCFVAPLCRTCPPGKIGANAKQCSKYPFQTGSSERCKNQW